MSSDEDYQESNETKRKQHKGRPTKKKKANSDSDENESSKISNEEVSFFPILVRIRHELALLFFKCKTAYSEKSFIVSA